MVSARICIAFGSILAVALAGLAPVATAAAAPNGTGTRCSPGARTLGTPGDRLYPETGNGGYRSVHTNVDMVYDATGNRFLPGNKVELTDQATQCLTEFSLDFEHISADAVAGPNLVVGSVMVDGAPAAFTFVRPTYPGDPEGPNDPNPAAHEVSQTNPVGGPQQNPFPPACSPELTTAQAATPDIQDGAQCPANKLVITPVQPIRRGATFSVTVAYTGRPGIHHDGDGDSEGWFRATGGDFVTTEPVGTEAWMPLNNFPTAKPTYDFYDTVATGKTAIANGGLVSLTPHAADAEFPAGSFTWHWHSPAPIANYLVEESVGNYKLTRRTAANGVVFYEAQDTSIPAAQQAANLAVMNLQESITDYESQFSGPYPFASAGVFIGTPPASFEEEMQTMIAFAGGIINTSLLYHENMHQWWGDNVTEAGYNATFYKEGLASLAQDLYIAKTSEDAAGGPTTVAGRAAFEARLVDRFNTIYASGTSIWTGAPSNPTPATLFSQLDTYIRPEAAYIALRKILGSPAFDRALQSIQRERAGGNIDEVELEAAFHKEMPNKSRACSERLDAFFSEWFDTVYPSGGGINRPQITAPGLTGPGFYNATGGCS